MAVKDFLGGIVPSLVVSVVVSVGSAVMNQQTHSRLLEDNIVATRELSRSLEDLRVQIGVLGERFVTKDKFNEALVSLQAKGGK